MRTDGKTRAPTALLLACLLIVAGCRLNIGGASPGREADETRRDLSGGIDEPRPGEPREND